MIMKQFAGLFAASSLLMATTAQAQEENAGIPYQQIETCFKGIKSASDTMMSKTPERHIAEAVHEVGNIRCGVQMDGIKHNDNFHILISGFVTATKPDATQTQYEFSGKIDEDIYNMRIKDAGMDYSISKPIGKGTQESRIEFVASAGSFNREDIAYLQEEAAKGVLTSTEKDGKLTVVIPAGKPGNWLPEEFSATAEDVISEGLDVMEKIANGDIPLIAKAAAKPPSLAR